MKVKLLLIISLIVAPIVFADGGHGGGGPNGKGKSGSSNLLIEMKLGSGEPSHGPRTQGGEGNKSSVEKTTEKGGASGRNGGTGTFGGIGN